MSGRLRADSEMYTEYRYRLVYAYDKRTDRMADALFRDRSAASNLIDVDFKQSRRRPLSAMARILQKLPYKRIRLISKRRAAPFRACRQKRRTAALNPDQYLPQSIKKDGKIQSVLFALPFLHTVSTIPFNGMVL